MALPGPPLVIVQKRSKAMIELMVVRIKTSSSIGRSQGSVILVNRAQGPAPSIRAARCRFSGIDCRPARSKQRGQRRLVPDVDDGNQIERRPAIGEPGDGLVDQPEVEEDAVEGAVIAIQHPGPEDAHGDGRHRPGHED